MNGPPIKPDVWPTLTPALTVVPEPADVDDEDDAPNRKSAATVLLDLARSRYRLGMSEDDDVFAVPVTGPQVLRFLRGSRGSMRAELASAYFAATGRAASQQALADALLVLDGQARELDPEALWLRVAEHEGDLYLDLGDATGRAVRITRSGWTLTDRPPVWFRRTALTGPLPVPVSGGGLDDLWTLLNVAESDRPLVVAWLVAALHPAIPHPIVALVGEQGTGKTTAARVLAGILDPSPAQVRKMPRDDNGWTLAASGSWIAAVDNVSAIPPWWSDALCRAVTGDGDVRRRLYSDADMAVFAFRRAVILTGIDLGALRGDLAERLVRVELEVINTRSRRTDRDMTEAWAAVHPRVLGAVLDLAVEVMREADRLRLESLPRMADFARVLAAVDNVMGTRGFDRYMSQADSLAGDVVASEPVIARLVEVITGPFSGTAADLLPILTPEGRALRDWPTNPRSLTAMLRRHSPALRRLGWHVASSSDGHTKVLRWHLTPPSALDAAGSTPAIPATPATGANPGGHAGVAGIGNGASQDDEAICPHGISGGHLPDDFVGGAARCPQCRKAGAA